jgi:monofunctional biosynthetic peptidoglycan transglycosylase
MFNFLRLVIKKIAFASAFVVLVSAVSGVYLYITLPEVSSLAKNNPKQTSFIDLRRTQAQRKGIDFDLQWKWVPLSDISPYIVNSLVYTEDITFWRHSGIEWNSILHALDIFWHQHQFVTGGSTITQQVAKNLYLSPDRNIVRKGREFLLALELERHLSKERILEIYLNIIEWGDGVFGIEAASQYWFSCSANELTPNQAVNLALIVPNPHDRDPTNPPVTFNRAIHQILLMLAQDGIISGERAIAEMNIEIPSVPLDENVVYKML